jgi:hypothetical protein
MIPTFLLGAFLVVAVLACVRAARRDRDSFNRRFPPISDAEFLARCTPGTSPRVALKVRRIVAENLGVPYERIYPSARFAEDLGAD